MEARGFAMLSVWVRYELPSGSLVALVGMDWHDPLPDPEPLSPQLNV